MNCRFYFIFGLFTCTTFLQNIRNEILLNLFILTELSGQQTVIFVPIFPMFNNSCPKYNTSASCFRCCPIDLNINWFLIKFTFNRLENERERENAFWYKLQLPFYWNHFDVLQHFHKWVLSMDHLRWAWMHRVWLGKIPEAEFTHWFQFK